MPVTITLQDKTAAALAARAKAAGLSIDEYLRRLTEAPALGSPDPTAPAPGTPDDFDAALDELFAADTTPLPATPLTYSRDDIYADRD